MFSPSEDEIQRAKGILRAMEEAQSNGRGAVVYQGKMIDAASIRQAEILVRKAEEISARTQ